MSIWGSKYCQPLSSECGKILVRMAWLKKIHPICFLPLTQGTIVENIGKALPKL